MELCGNDHVFRHRLSDQNLDLPLHPSNQENWLAEMGPLYVDGGPSNHECGAGNHSVRPMSSSPIILGPKYRPMLGSKHI